MSYRIFPLLFLLFALFACEQIPVEPLEKRLGLAYAPIEVGRYIIYEVTEKIYSLSAPMEEKKYQLLERIAETFEDIQGENALRIERFKRNTVTEPWQIDSVWVAKRTSQLFIKTENNIPYIKLTFPIQENKTWNGNARNNFSEQTYRMTNLNQRRRIRNLTFDRTLQVIQRRDSSLVGLNKQIEIYAENVGLIYKESNVVTYCSTPNCLGQGIISFGNITTFQIIAYGQD
ncbi:MAG: hypothetical protein NZ551_12370 [Microscillaceae bacterium]|nr:hypothetical protein [Microscillaceae bacterium]MDW8461988.1 hypothetical protein [Cytophagales bacterium]